MSHSRDGNGRTRPRQSYDDGYRRNVNFSQESLGRNYSLSARPSSESSRSDSRSPSPRRRRSRYRDDRRHRRRYSDSSRSPSRSRSRSRRPPRPTFVEPAPPPDVEKEWWKRKTLWATLASAATIAALMPSTMSARATGKSAKATTMSAKATRQSAAATTRSAEATERSARAVEKATKVAIRSANAVERSADAVVNTAVANGHQDHFGRYTGSNGKAGGQAMGRSNRTRSERSVGPRGDRRLLEYGAAAPVGAAHNALPAKATT